jgi:hypothetical protein
MRQTESNRDHLAVGVMKSEARKQVLVEQIRTVANANHFELQGLE